MPVSFSVSTIELTDGTTISPPVNGMTLFVLPECAECATNAAGWSSCGQRSA